MMKFLKLFETTVLFSFFPKMDGSNNQFSNVKFLVETDVAVLQKPWPLMELVSLGSLLHRHPSAPTVNASSISQPDWEEWFLEKSHRSDGRRMPPSAG